MLSLGAFAFAAPGMLALLLALPVIYWLLRMIPPLPRLGRFPAIRLLIGLEPSEQTPMKMPWWLLLLRLLLATLLILAVARPLLHPQAEVPGKGPVLIRPAPLPLDAPAVRKGALRPDETRTILRAFRPKPWPTDRAAAANEID